jgi:hypothetical protein
MIPRSVDVSGDDAGRLFGGDLGDEFGKDLARVLGCSLGDDVGDDTARDFVDDDSGGNSVEGSAVVCGKGSGASFGSSGRPNNLSAARRVSLS